MNKKIMLISALLAGFLLASCVQVPQESIQTRKQNNVAISSVRDMPVNFPQGSLFSLAPKYVKETSLKATQTQSIYALYSNAIVNDLIQHGFNKASSSKSAAFHVGFGIALESDLSDATINEKFGVTPGLPHSEGLQKGSFLIYIQDAVTGHRVWRGAAQGFAHEDISTNEREVRVENIVNTVMTQFYATN
jgi:hypothetical protein